MAIIQAVSKISDYYRDLALRPETAQNTMATEVYKSALSATTKYSSSNRSKQTTQTNTFESR